MRRNRDLGEHFCHQVFELGARAERHGADPASVRDAMAEAMLRYLTARAPLVEVVDVLHRHVTRMAAGD
ncbi:MAG: hypothetical protein MUC86_05005 [Burkholderiaceae bacterium]|nr:hypothetical protein [Burkholderiaceae bacterium]